MSTRRPTQRRSTASTVLVAAVATTAAVLAYKYLSEPLSRWWQSSRGSNSDDSDHGVSEDDNSSDNTGKSHTGKQARPARKRKVAVVMSEKLASLNLLDSTTKDLVDLLILYPTYLAEPSSSQTPTIPSLATLRADYVTHPTHVFTLSKAESIKPILRHLATDEAESIFVVVADENRALRNDESISRFVGDVVVVEGPDASEIWRKQVLCVE